MKYLFFIKGNGIICLSNIFEKHIARLKQYDIKDENKLKLKNFKIIFKMYNRKWLSAV